MIVQTKVIAYQHITNKEKNQQYTKVWVSLPAVDGVEGTPVESAITQFSPNIDVGGDCYIACNRWGKLLDVNIL